jgi:hypothetical protein
VANQDGKSPFLIAEAKVSVTLIARDISKIQSFSLSFLPLTKEILCSAYHEAQAKEDESPAVELDKNSMLIKLENEEDTN